MDFWDISRKKYTNSLKMSRFIFSADYFAHSTVFQFNLYTNCEPTTFCHVEKLQKKKIAKTVSDWTRREKNGLRNCENMECAVVSEDLQILEFKKEAFCGRNEFKMDVQKLIWNHSNSIFGTIQTNSDMICIYYKNNGRVFREFSHFIADRNTLKKVDYT